jgi:hypothetical protein
MQLELPSIPFLLQSIRQKQNAIQSAHGSCLSWHRDVSLAGQPQRRFEWSGSYVDTGLLWPIAVLHCRLLRGWWGTNYNFDLFGSGQDSNGALPNTEPDRSVQNTRTCPENLQVW